MPVYLFFDESGNLDFSRNGTKHYLFGVPTTTVYCTWALYRRWQREDLRSYDLIKQFVRSELDVLGEVPAGG